MEILITFILLILMLLVAIREYGLYFKGLVSTNWSIFKFWFKDTFQTEHECRYLQGDVMDFTSIPKCVGCGKELEIAKKNFNNTGDIII